MALINCPECGKEVSDQAKSCIHCGFPLETRKNNNMITASSSDTQSIVDDADVCRGCGDYVKALSLYEKAGELGHALAQVWAGNIYDRGLGVEKNPSKAVFWYEKAAAQNHPSGLNNLGILYEAGRGVPKNVQKAIDLYIRASNAGNSFASKNLGSLYNFGTDVPRNYELAVKYYTLGLQQGSTDPVLMNNLAVLYMDGRGTPRNYAKAENLLLQAIKQGHTQAQNNYNILKQRTASNNNPTTSQTSQPASTNGKTILWLIAGVVALVLMLSMCSSGSGDDGKCDVAGCTRSATCHFGDMEMCTKHYAEWSDKAYDYNHRDD